ncbi:hypothetical protein [Rathayibacter tritici]|nr:hypothetical protein [Rathayibacter tritici]
MKKAMIPAALVASMGLMGATPAMAAEAASATSSQSAISSDSDAKIREHLAKYDVTGSTAEGIIQKAKDGIALDADTDTNPTTRDVMTVDGVSVSVQRYEDGSFIALPRAATSSKDDHLRTSTVAATDGSYTLGDGITGCESLTSVGTAPYVNCSINYTGSLYSGSFSANFTLSNTGKASIQRVWNENASVVAGTFGDTPTVSITNATEGTSPAEARLYFTYGSTADLAGSTGSIRLVASGTSASVVSP